MSVFVSVEDREGDLLIDVFELNRIVRRFAVQKGPCLRFVGDEEDASFNVLQIPVILDELEGLAGQSLDDAEAEELKRLVDVCRKYAGRRHVHLRFYGDTGSAEE